MAGLHLGDQPRGGAGREQVGPMPVHPGEVFVSEGDRAAVQGDRAAGRDVVAAHTRAAHRVHLHAGGPQRRERVPADEASGAGDEHAAHGWRAAQTALFAGS